MDIRSLVIALSCLLLLAACGQEPSSTPPAEGQPAAPARVTPPDSDTQTPDVHALDQLSPREEIAQRLQAYYQDLEAETLDESRYFAPVVEKFYSQVRQPREKIGEIIREGFGQVEDRQISLNLSSLKITEEGGQYTAEFSGHSSLVRSADGSRQEEDFRNRFVFNKDFLITEYGPAGADPSTQRVMSPAAQAQARIQALVSALASWDLRKANQLIHPERGLYYLTRPGAFDAVYAVKNFEEIVAYSPWMEKSFRNFSCDLKIESLPDFDCEDFSKQGCFLDEVKQYDRLSVLLDALIENELNLFDKTQIAAAKSAEKLVRLQLTQTQIPIALLFGQIDGEWYLLVVDAAIFDCSA